MYEKLLSRHRLLLAREPTGEQLNLYRAYPEKVGFMAPDGLTATQEEMLFEAVFVAAFGQTFRDHAAHTSPTVYLFVPPALSEWTRKSIDRITRTIFGVCREQKAVEKARHLGELLGHVYVGSHVTSTTIMPDHWGAYGYREPDGAPKWLTERLMVLPSFLREDDP